MSKPRRRKPTAADRKQPTSAAQRLAAERAAAARDRIAAAQRRRQLMLAASGVAVVVLIAAILVIVKVTSGSDAKSGPAATGLPASVAKQIATVPAATFDSVGVGTVAAYPKAISGITTGYGGSDASKPTIFYAGAEYCPYCATERWAVAVALSRFGTLHGLGKTHSSSTDVYPSTPTITFHDATYTSSLLNFVGKEMQGNKVVDGSYTTLDKLTSAQQSLLEKYDAPPYVPSSAKGSIPFIYLGGKYMISGAQYDPTVLHGKTQAEVAAALADPSSAIAKGVDGTANVITAALCKLTGGKPGAVCTSSGVEAGAAKLPSST